MSKISKKLERSQNEICEFDHNGQIKEFLIGLGVASQFTQKPTGPKETIQAIPYVTHNTHYILIALWLGYDDENQNGYRLWCIPKSEYSVEQFMELGKAVLHPTDDKMLKAEIFWSGPGNPSN